MPFRAVIQNGSLYAELQDADIYGLTDQSALPSRNASRVWSQTATGFRDVLATVRHANRDLKLVANLFGTSVQDWVDNQHNVEDILLDAEKFWITDGQEGARAYLYLESNGSGSLPIVYDVMAGQLHTPAQFGFNMAMDDPPIYNNGEIDLFTTHWGRSPTTTIEESINLNNGGGVSGSSPAAPGAYLFNLPEGQVKTPVRLTYAPATGDLIRRIIFGTKAQGIPSNFIFDLDCEAGTNKGNGTYDVVDISIVDASITITPNRVVPGAHRGQEYRVESDSSGTPLSQYKLLRWTIKKNINDFKGTYRVILRLDSSTNPSNKFTSMFLTYGSTGNRITLPTVNFPTITTKTDTLVDLGTMTIPDVDWPADRVPPNFIFELAVNISAVANTQSVDFDCIYLIPLDGIQGDITLSAISVSLDQLVFDNLANEPDVFLVDSAGDIKTVTITKVPDPRFSFDPKVNTGIYFLVLRTDDLTDVSSHDLTDVGAFYLEHFDLYSQLR